MSQSCGNGRSGRVAELLAADASMLDAEDGDGWTCLINASKTGRTDLVRWLIVLGCSLCPSSKHSALRGAALYGHFDVVRLLLKAGHQVDALSAGRKTPLMGAAMNGHLEVAKMLLDSGADPRLRNDRNESALDLALSGGYSDVAAVIANAVNG